MKQNGPTKIAGILAAYLAMTVALPLAGGLLVRSVQPAEPQQEKAQQEQQLADVPLAQQPAAEQTVCLWDDAVGEVLTLPLEEYLLGAAASEMPQSYGDEAIKAQIVATHSYYEHCRQNGSFELEGGAVLRVNTAKREGYLTPEARAEAWGDWLSQNTARMQLLVQQVKEQLLQYGGVPAAACYYALSAGVTADAADIWGRQTPYLVSVDSVWDMQAADWEQTLTFSYQQMYDVLAARFVGLDLSGDPADWFGRAETTPQGYVTSITVGGAQVSGSDLRTQLGLRSTCMTVHAQDGVFVVITRGYGHGVGMSQYGANAMAAEGSTCEEILAHYYPGTQLVQTA